MSRPTRVARNVSDPVLLIVAPITVSPRLLLDRNRFSRHHRLVHGRAARHDRSVDRDLLARPDDDEIAGRDDRQGTSISAPSRITRAVFGARPIRRLTASEVRPFARASNSRPRRIRTMIAPAVSK